MTTGDFSRAARRQRQRQRRRRRVIAWALISLVLVLAGGGGFLLRKASSMSAKVFTGGGGVVGLVAAGEPLATDANGRVNILVFGTSQDDPAHATGAGGQGMWLTDSIQVLSIDPASRTAVMVSIPRDTWVKLERKCVVGYEAKINAVYECATGVFSTPQAQVPDYGTLDQAGAKALVSAVHAVTGLQAQYWVHVNYTVLRSAVDAVGGIDVEIVGNGHEGIFDTNADLDCPHEDVSCRKVYYPRDGVYHLDGEHALNLARARGDANPRSCMQFGLDGGDFDRQANQQKITVALKDRAVSAGTLANPAAINGLIDALGDNVTTNFSTDEAKTALSLARDLGTMSAISLVDPAQPVMTTGTISGQSVVLPVAGPANFTAVHRYIASRTTALTTRAPGTASTASAPSTASAGTSTTPATTPAPPVPGAPKTAPAPAKATPKSTYEPPASCWER